MFAKREGTGPAHQLIDPLQCQVCLSAPAQRVWAASLPGMLPQLPEVTYMRSGVLMTAAVLCSGAETGKTLWGCSSLFIFNSMFIRNPGFLFMLTDKLIWKSKDVAPSFCCMLLTP